MCSCYCSGLRCLSLSVMCLSISIQFWGSFSKTSNQVSMRLWRHRRQIIWCKCTRNVNLCVCSRVWCLLNTLNAKLQVHFDTVTVWNVGQRHALIEGGKTDYLRTWKSWEEEIYLFSHLRLCLLVLGDHASSTMTNFADSIYCDKIL